MGIPQCTFQIILFQQIAVGADLHFATGTQIGQGTEHCSILPAIGFSFKFLHKVFQRSSDTNPVIVLDKRQNFLFRLRKRGGVVSEQPLL